MIDCHIEASAKWRLWPLAGYSWTTNRYTLTLFLNLPFSTLRFLYYTK